MQTKWWSSTCSSCFLGKTTVLQCAAKRGCQTTWSHHLCSSLLVLLLFLWTNASGLVLLLIFQSFTYLDKSTGCARFMDQKLCGNIWVQLDLLDQLPRNWVRCPLNKNRVVPVALSSFSDLVLTPHLIQHFLQDNSHWKCLAPCQGWEGNGEEGWGERIWHFI